MARNRHFSYEKFCKKSHTFGCIWLALKWAWLVIYQLIFYQHFLLVSSIFLYESRINHIGNTGIWLEAWKLFCINFNYKRAVLSFLWPGPYQNSIDFCIRYQISNRSRLSKFGQIMQLAVGTFIVVIISYRFLAI